MVDQLIATLLSGGHLSEKEVRSISFQVFQILINEPTLLNLHPPLYVCGDIHGQLFDLLKLFSVCGGITGSTFLFLGDYVDRGYYSVETVMLLFLYKIKYPDRIYLLRGNHECKSLSRIYGFYEEVERKYGGVSAWKHITDAFCGLPLAAIVGGEILCLHGGLSPQLEWADEIQNIDREIEIPETGLMADLLWSDPQKMEEDWKVNPRGAGYLFSHQNTLRFNKRNKLRLICRSHQLVQKGFNYNFSDHSVVTIWSAPNYYYRCNNKAAVMHVDATLAQNFLQFDSAEQNSQNIQIEYVLPYFL